MKTFALMLCLSLVAASSCASESKVIFITGESLLALDETFVAVGTSMKSGCDAKVIAVEKCAAWRTFGKKYQQAEPLARDLWKVADANQDAALEAQVGAVLAKFTADLAEFATLVGVK